jgi:hypothetical protein
VQRSLWDLGDEPLPRLTSHRVEARRGGVLRVRAHTDHVREIERVVVAPFVGGAEVAAVAGFEPGDAVGKKRLELVRALQRLVGHASPG